MQYTPQSPDFTSHVIDLARDYPALWDAARERPDGSRDGRFAKVLAYCLNRHVDPRVGLNGKRGGDELSTDALAYQNFTAPGGAEVRDFIVGATHSAAWQDTTLPPFPDPRHDPNVPEGVLGRFIYPALTPELRGLLRPDHIHPDEREQAPTPPIPSPSDPGDPGQPPPSDEPGTPGDLAALHAVLESMYTVLERLDARQNMIELTLTSVLNGLVELKLPADTIVNLTLLSERLKNTTLLQDVASVKTQLDRGFQVQSKWLGNPKITPIPAPR